MIKITEWYDIVLLAITTISLFGTFYTIALIIWITPKSMSEYRWFLLLYTISDTAFTFMYGIILFPKFVPPSTCCIVQGIGSDIYFWAKKSYGEEGGDFIIRIGFMILVWFIVDIISTQDYCLIYRFTIVHPNQKFHDLLVNKKFVCCTVTFATLLCFAFSVPCFQTIPGATETQILMKEHEKKYPGIFDEIPGDAVIMWLREDTGETTLLFGLVFVGFLLSEIVAISSVFFILKILRQNAASFSAQTYRLHRQMTFLLIFQICNPLIFIIFPIVTCVFLIIYKVEVNQMTVIYGVLFMSFYSFSNTILTVGFVTPYRKYTLKILLNLPLLKKYQKVTQIAPVPSTSVGSFGIQAIRIH